MTSSKHRTETHFLFDGSQEHFVTRAGRILKLGLKLTLAFWRHHKIKRILPLIETAGPLVFAFAPD